MSRIYQSVTSYLPFGRKAQPPAEPESDFKPEEKSPDVEAKNIENGKHKPSEGVPGPDGDHVDVDTKNGDVKDSEEKDDASSLMSNKKTDEEYDPKAQPGYIRWAAGGLVGAASSTVGYGVGGIKWVANTGYSATSTVVTTTTGVIKKVPQAVRIRRKDKKE